MGKTPAFIATSLIISAFLYVSFQMFVPALHRSVPLEVKVEKGMSFREATRMLAGHGLVRDEKVFVALGRLTGLDRGLTPGFYSFFGNVSPWKVFVSLWRGNVISWQVTVVEGDTLEDIKDKLVGKGITTEEEFDSLASDPGLLEALKVDAPSLEGYLFPDTYRIPKGLGPRDIFTMMVNRLRHSYTDKMLARAEELGLSERDMLALASIIEKEAVYNSERPVISAVYHNRLAKGMPLQADPTAVYGVKPMRFGITRRDIRRKTDYNTYFIKGLPPGPIASPGLQSIKAALYPSDVSYLYFVSNNDGTHTFSVTLEEHLKAVETYRSLKAASGVEG
ncbi:MAG: endolytic transglycosylase MltG [Thermodesulfovibrionales bacterium]